MAVSLFDNMMASCDGILDEMFGKAYSLRWKGEIVPITATLQSHGSIAEATNGGSSGAILTESWHGHNFIIPATDFVFFGEQIEPVAGMEIAEELADGGYVIYELMPPDGKRVFEPVDSEGIKLFVFAVEVRREPAP